MPDSLTLKPGAKVGPGRFTLIKELGRGGMGVVWLAQDTHLGEQVALKFLPPEVAADPVSLNDLRRETVRSHRLTHPNIIRIHDFHQPPDGLAFISMEYVDGQTLSGWRLQQPQQVLSWEQLGPLVEQLCVALQYAHGEAVIHRDLKPANVMLDSRGRIKLADFGIAAVVSDSMSRVSARSRTGGTLAYMSPQQLSGKMPAVTDDVYALGATLYELLTGRPPFYSGDITHQVLNVPAQPVSERLLDLGVDNPVPAEVGALIMACLAKEPGQRPPSAQAVAAWVGLTEQNLSSVEQVAAAVGGQSESLVDVSDAGAAVSRLPWWKRWPGWVAGVAGLALLLIAVGGLPALKRMRGASQALPGGRWTNSLGLVFVPVPGTKVSLAIWETRVQDFASFVRATTYPMGKNMYGHQKDGWKEREGYDWRNPGFAQGPNHPVVGVNWDEAQAFCQWLTKKEQDEGTLDRKRQYRLPSDGEWSRAVGEAKYPWGDTWPPPAGAGNYASEETRDDNFPKDLVIIPGFRDGYVRTSPVGSFTPNHYGLYDLGGNAWEWCLDWYRKEMNDASVLETFPGLKADQGGQTYRIFRGSGWNDAHPTVLLSANRMGDGFAEPAKRYDNTGFRVALGDAAPRTSPAQTKQMPAADTSNDHLTNSLGMIVVPVPGTDVKFSIWETRVQDFASFAEDTGFKTANQILCLVAGSFQTRAGYNWQNPGFPQTPTHPVVGVSWDDAQAFCRWLTAKELRAGKVSADMAYRLPTDFEWSEAAGLRSEIGDTPAERSKNKRVGSYYWGSQWPPPPRSGNFADETTQANGWPPDLRSISGYSDGFARTAPVGSFNPNHQGLYDLEGNVSEWCQDAFDQTRTTFVTRGGSWAAGDPEWTSSENRQWFSPGNRRNHPSNFRAVAVGFRVVLASGEPINRAESAAPFKRREGFISLFNGRDLAGWKLSDSSPQKRSWQVENGTLVNRGEDRTRASSIFTEQPYRDFVLYLEFNLPPRGNSGVYLRGRHEVQLLDDALDRAPKNTSTGAVYKDITPSVLASKPAGEWQTLEVTLIGDRISVTLNGILVIKAGQLGEPYRPPIPAIDRGAPGPVYLQGDSGSVSFRNLCIKNLP